MLKAGKMRAKKRRLPVEDVPLVEPMRFELTASSLRTTRSTN